MTSTKSTRISITPNTLSQNGAKAVSRCSREGKEFRGTRSPKPKRHNNRRDLLPDIAAKTRRECSEAVGYDGCCHILRAYWYAVSGTTLSSFPSSIFTSASSIFATFLKHTHTNRERQNIYAATVPLQSSSFFISHPFTPESEPGLKYTEDMVRLPSSSLCSELGMSVF